jgi:hypothetical protein
MNMLMNTLGRGLDGPTLMKATRGFKMAWSINRENYWNGRLLQ